MRELTLAIITLALTWFVAKAFRALIEKVGAEKQISEKRVASVRKVVQSVIYLAGLILLTLILGIDYNHILLFASSAFALLGVALFAQWSILSNVTASVIVYFFFPYRIGDDVRVVDGDDSIHGTIKEITLFHVILVDEKAQIVTYPNSLVFQKAVIITTPKGDRA